MMRGSTTVIGLDIGARYVKALQLRRAGGTSRIIASARVARASERPFDAAEAARVADVLDRQGFAGRRVVTAFGTEKLMVSNLELPAPAGSVPQADIARMELARVHARDARSFELSQWAVPSPARASKSAQVMAVACPHETAEVLIDALLSVNVFVDAIDLQACALARACAAQVANSGSTGLLTLLDLGWSAARLAILHGGVVIYCRVIEKGGIGNLVHDLQKQFELDPQVWEDDAAQGLLLDSSNEETAEVRSAVNSHVDQIVREMQSSFSYAAHQYPDVPVSRVLVAGGGAQIPGVIDRLRALLPQDVQAASVGGVEAAAGATMNASMTLAAGLALYEDA